MKTALIIGAGMSGMLTARVLSDHFEKVLIIEKDSLPTLDDCSEGIIRKGLPQAHHQHILLMRGRQIFETLFPGFDQELADLGAPLVSYSNDVQLYVGHNKLPRFPSDLEIRPCQRPLIDTVLHKRLALRSNIEIISSCKVLRLLTNDKITRITGVLAEVKTTNKNDSLKEIQADLVVECSGRGSKLSKWLEALGFPSPPCTEVDPKLGYASRLYTLPPEFKDKAHSVEVAPHAPDNPRAAGLWQVENQQWLLTLIGMAKKYPPNDDAGFLSFAQALTTPDISNFIKKAIPASDINSHRGTKNIWRHYDRLDHHPDGLLVMGDAICAFNPLHGQGFTLIGMSAEVLQKYISEGFKHQFSAKWSQKIYRRFNRVFLTAWMFAISEDMRWPETEGRRLDWRLKIAYRYTDLLLLTCATSPAVTKTCLSVANMMSSPAALFHPRIIFTMLSHKFRASRHKKNGALRPKQTIQTNQHKS